MWMGMKSCWSSSTTFEGQKVSLRAKLKLRFPYGASVEGDRSTVAGEDEIRSCHVQPATWYYWTPKHLIEMRQMINIRHRKGADAYHVKAENVTCDRLEADRKTSNKPSRKDVYINNSPYSNMSFLGFVVAIREWCLRRSSGDVNFWTR